jgi:hypothetical protein
LDDLKKWIGEIRSLTKEWQTFGSMDPCKVAAIEKYMDNFNKENHHSKKSITLNVKPPCLFKVNLFSLDSILHYIIKNYNYFLASN